MILVLAGTGEARHLLIQCADLPVTASLAGVTRRPKPLAVPTRIGGFGGEAGFAAYLRDHAVTAVLDATHPYAATMPLRAARICGARNIPYLRLLRPEWSPRPGDDWTEIDSFAQAADILPPDAHVFLATGGQSAPHLGPLHHLTLWLRRVDDIGPANWPKGGYIHGLPAHSADAELKMFEKHNITHLISKNSGGPQGIAKLHAARTIGLPVLMLRRPAAPDAPTTHDPATALDWIKSHAHH